MSTEEGSRSDRNIDRNRLLKRMVDAKISGNRRDVDNTLAEAKQWLRDNRVGETTVSAITRFEKPSFSCTKRFHRPNSEDSREWKRKPNGANKQAEIL